jgi:ABC-type sugar transport system ATPase subunit
MILHMIDISKFFDTFKALDKVSLVVDKCEIHGLLGENGAGKSTLMNILGGSFPPTSGQIFFKGEKQESLTTRKCNDLGIRFIHQELNLINDLMVYENLFLGAEILNKYGLLDKKAMIDKSKEVFKRMNLDIDVEELVANLDTSRKQLVEIAKALLFKSELIIMDEPTSALTNKEIDNLFDIMRGLKKQGVSIIYISHKMPELFKICDSYTVLRDGKFIETGKFSDIDERKATQLLVGRSIAYENINKSEVLDEVVLSVKDLSSALVFTNISFDVKKGEVIAITGLHGDGRGELAEALFGVRAVSSGKVILKGKDLKLSNIKKIIQQGIGMVPRNRKERSIIKDMSILDNLSIAYFVSKHKKLTINNAEEIRIFKKSKEKTDIKVDNPNDFITFLSGGNQQKIIISRWLELDCDVYILDNPTQGIDVGAKFEIYKIINELAKRGKSIIVFTAEFPEIYRVADRCLVMYKGQINAKLNRDELTEIKIMHYATGSNLEVKK